MKIEILTLFPEMLSPLFCSITGRAVSSGKLEITAVDIRNYSQNKHGKCDDYPFGGGAGMVMTAQPIASAIEAVDPAHEAHRVYMSPKGSTFNSAAAKRLAQKDRLIILCGHYEGVDQRVIDLYIDEEISIGDYVLTGGELPAMVVADCVSRFVDGVIAEESLFNESFEEGLEYPHYTRPEEFMGLKVPEVLRSGNHGEIEKWRRQQSKKITLERRPELLDKKVDG